MGRGLFIILALLLGAFGLWGVGGLPYGRSVTYLI